MKKFRGKQPRKKGKDFWNKEYKESGHLALSINPSEDLEKFTRWLQRDQGFVLRQGGSVLDIGCGNGRNLFYLTSTFGVGGVGFDISAEAIAQAQKMSAGLPLKYHVQSMAETIDVPDASQDLVLDMMASHFLNEEQRATLKKEIYRVLKPGGWFFYKTFLRDGDLHAERMLRDYPADEAGTYIHPKIGVAEHVMTEAEIYDTLEPDFIIHKIKKSHRHRDARGHALKRRHVSVYAQKNG